ncbi:hypothetical protein [Halalkalibacter oceani]|uniref:hypothetical protein n=1 Tax=Halalkalibacter oceani TaxID=1653776 RepID=UPI0033973772
MTYEERIHKAKKELQEWIKMHDGVIPSEDLEAFEKDVEERQWLIHQAEKAIRYEKTLKRIATPGLGLGYWEAKKALEDKK